MQLELRDISKHFGNLKANDGVDLTVKAGSIHAVLGENGAGKSTLMKILAGYLRRSGGEIRIDGRAVDYRSPAEAANLGIGMLYQDPLDFPNLTVLENFMLGQAGGLRCTPRVWLRKLENLAARFEFLLQPHAPVGMLTVGERQQLEILRLLSLGIRVLILDEPTTGISAQQKAVLFKALTNLAREDKSVVLVSHKLEDVAALCDTVTVLRHGKVAGCMPAPFDTHGLLGLMFDALPEPPARRSAFNGSPILEFKAVAGTGGRTGLKPCDVSIRRGEVVGLAGLEGSGQGVFLKIAAGLKRPGRGSVYIDRVAMAGKTHRAFLAAGVAFLPATRLEEGLMPGLTIAEHVALQNRSDTYTIQWPAALDMARAAIEAFHIKGQPQSLVESLSGGNQQRLLLSFLPSRPKLLLLENPARGLDLESARWVWNHLLAFKNEGTGIVFASSELDEIMMAADRILVFFEGRIIKDVAAQETDSYQLSRAIAGKV
jgi:general nucleoside transport system ATP-binding protein